MTRYPQTIRSTEERNMVDRDAGPSRYEAHAHCHFCGGALTLAKPHDGGLECYKCHNVNYRNPTPVAVLIIPCDVGGRGKEIMAIRRNIEPFRGKLALPGGFILNGESWQRAGAREANEETGCAIREHTLEWPQHFMTESTPDGKNILIIGTARAFYLGDWKPNHEVQEVVRYTPDSLEKLCFPIHEKAAQLFFAQTS